MIRAILLLCLVAPAFAEPPQAPGSVTIQLGKGQVPADVKITKRKGTTSKSVLLTVNPDWPVTILEFVEMHGGLHVDTSTLPTFAKGSTELRVKATTLTTDPSTAGAFRTVCPEPVAMAFDDSLVYPGQPGKAHFHTFYSNDGSNAYSTADSLRTTGGGGCHGGIANRSSYWFPAMLDTRTAKPIKPTNLLVYYKNGNFSTTGSADGWVKPVAAYGGFNDLPVGLAMIAGSPGRTTARKNSDAFDFRWSCITPTGTTTQTSEIPVDCPVGAYVDQEIMFPQCWDGKNLDSPDHKAHMSFLVLVPNVGDPRGWSHYECPTTHPKIIPAISFNVRYDVTADSLPKFWRLVSDMYEGPAGYSSHGDWRNGWDPAISSAWTENCIRKMRDCHADLLGDGRILY